MHNRNPRAGIRGKILIFKNFSLRNLSAFVSAVISASPVKRTAETQRTQRRREEPIKKAVTEFSITAIHIKTPDEIVELLEHKPQTNQQKQIRGSPVAGDPPIQKLEVYS